jgi:hypothetical protein
VPEPPADYGHLIAGALLIVSATVALCLGDLSEGAYLGLLGAGPGPAVLKGVRS